MIYPDCGDNSCFFNQLRGYKTEGLKTNGGCRCSAHDFKRELVKADRKFKEVQEELDLMYRCMNKDDAMMLLECIEDIVKDKEK